MLPDDLDYELLRYIGGQENTNQRDLAARLGVSVGKVNYCMRAVVARGWVKVNNFRRSDNKRAYAYLLTPSGAVAKVRLAQVFLERKEREFEALRSAIAVLRQEIQLAESTE